MVIHVRFPKQRPRSASVFTLGLTQPGPVTPVPGEHTQVSSHTLHCGQVLLKSRGFFFFHHVRIYSTLARMGPFPELSNPMQSNTIFL